MGSIIDAIKLLEQNIHNEEEKVETELVEGLTNTNIPMDLGYIKGRLTSINDQRMVLDFLKKQLKERE